MKDWVLRQCGEPDFSPSQKADPPARNLRLVKAKAEPASAPKPFYDAHLIRRGYTRTAEYDYFDVDGVLQFQVLRYEHPTETKTFLQRQPDGKGEWLSGRGEPILYRLHELAANVEDPVFIVEGEKDADRLASHGYLATTVPNGSWPEDLSILSGRAVFVLADNDDAGDKKAKAAVEHLQCMAIVRRVHLADLPQNGDVSDWLNAGHSTDELEGLCLAATPVAANDNDQSARDVVAALPVVNPVDWHGQEVPSREWFIEGLIPHRQVTILAGDGGVGKSLLALQFGAASALGVETAGFAPKPGRVVYLGAEDEGDEFHRRLLDIVRGHGRQLSDLGEFRLIPMADLDALLAVPDAKGVMAPTGVWLQFCALAREFRPAFVALDTVADLFGGDEIKRGQARQFIGMLRRLAIEVDCSIVLLAHPSQEGIRSGSGSSGSTGWKNSSRSMLYFSRPDGDKDVDPDLRILSTKKINYGKVGGETKLRWENGCFVLDAGSTSPALGIVNRKAESVFVQLLQTFARTGQHVGASPGTNYAPAKMAKHSDSEGLSKKTLEMAMQRLLEDGTVKLVWEGPASRQRQRLIVSADDYGARSDPD